MLVPRSFASIPRTGPYLTRRPCSGQMASGLIVPSLHAVLERHRPCVVHSVDTEIRADWQYGTSLPTAEEINVLVPTSDRGELLGVMVQYRSDATSSIACALTDMTGASVDAGFTWSTAADTMSPTVEVGCVYVGFAFRWSLSTVSSGDTPRAAAITTPRPLIVPAGYRGKLLQVTLTPVAAEILSVAVYELSPDEVTP